MACRRRSIGSNPDGSHHQPPGHCNIPWASTFISKPTTCAERVLSSTSIAGVGGFVLWNGTSVQRDTNTKTSPANPMNNRRHIQTAYSRASGGLGRLPPRHQIDISPQARQTRVTGYATRSRRQQLVRHSSVSKELQESIEIGLE